jgi:mono/diheme cytochrome c family protein
MSPIMPGMPDRLPLGILGRDGGRQAPFRWTSKAIWIPGLLLAVMLVACGGNSADDSPFPIKVTSERVAVGEQVYARNCTMCHGEVGAGATLPGSPSHAEDGHTWHHADRHLFEWVMDGPPLAQVMQGFRGTLSDDEVYAVLAYIKSTWPDDIQTRQNQMSAQVEKQVIEDAGG